MLKSADVVIVGGGIVGASIAYQLTSAGCCNVAILERESSQGKGSTGKSMGGVRAQFSTPVNIRMSLFSIPFFRDFEQTMGHPSGYRAQGYLFVATENRHLDYLRANYERQVAGGLKTASLVSRDDIDAMVPQLRSDDIIGGSFCSTDGFVDPYSVMTGFTLRAVDQGAELIRDAQVTGFRSTPKASPRSRPRKARSPRAPSSTRRARGPRRSRKWPASIFQSSLCAACWSPPNRSIRSSTARPW